MARQPDYDQLIPPLAKAGFRPVDHFLIHDGIVFVTDDLMWATASGPLSEHPALTGLRFRSINDEAYALALLGAVADVPV